MSYSKYEIILKAIELGSLTKAAIELGYTQSGMTHILNSLEAELGVQIINRTRNGISWNTTGEILAPYIEAIYDREKQLQNKIDAIKRSSLGIVRIGAFLSVSSYILPRFIASMGTLHPNIEIAIRIGECNELEELLMAGEIDLAFLMAPTNRIFDSTLILKDELLVALPEGHPLVKDRIIDADKLKQYPYIKYQHGDTREFQTIDGYDELAANAKYAVKEDATSLALVENKLGTTIIGKMIADHYQYRVVYRSLKPKAYRNIIMAKNNKLLLSPPAQLFFDEFINYQIQLKF